MATVTEIPAPESPEIEHLTEEHPPESDPIEVTSTETATPTEPPKAKPAPPLEKPKPKMGRPPKTRQNDFFERVAAVPLANWGTRAFMYVYIEEPVCNPKTWGETRYVLKSSKPILDLEPLKQQYGSFKGWMSLNLREEGQNKAQEVDRLNFEIFDSLAPCKIPRKAWANDERNRRWEAITPDDRVNPQAANGLTDAIKAYKEIRADIQDEIEVSDPGDRTRETLQTMKLAKELFAPPVAAAAATAAPLDPFAIAAQVMNMRQNDPMIGALMQRLDSMDKALESARDREFKLQQQLLEKAAAKDSKSWMEQLVELASNDKLEPVKKAFGGIFGVNGDNGGPGRSGRTNGWDLFQAFLQSDAAANIGQGLGILLANMSVARPPQNAPQPTGNIPPIGRVNADGTQVPPTNGTQSETDTQRIQRIVGNITQPMLYEYFLQGSSGEDFASFMFDGWPEDYVFVKRFGPQQMVNLYRQIPQHWAVIQPKESNFHKFVSEFCAWDPNQAQDDDEDSVTDLDDEEARS